MAALAAFLDLRLSISGPWPVFLWASVLLSHAKFVMLKSRAAMSELVSSISWIASAKRVLSNQINAGALCATTAKDRWGVDAPLSMILTQSSA